MSKKIFENTVPFFGIQLFGGTKELLLKKIYKHIQSAQGKGTDLLKICTPNPEQIVLSWENSRFFDTLSSSDICIPDGSGIIWALRYLRTPKAPTKRITGRELFHDLLNSAAQNQWKIFLVGGKEGSAAEIWEKYGNLSTKNPVCGFDGGAVNIAHETAAERARVLSAIKDACPDIVCVAYGAPWQEYWISDNADALARCGVRVACVVGGAFEYEAGRVPAVHPLVEMMHLEWFQRLLCEPWRARRQLKGLRFFWRVFFERNL